MCNGLAAYFDIDVTIVRIVFIGLALLTKGAWIVAYIVLMFVIPYASTSEERAAAHGLPFNAQELVDQAKKHYAGFRDNVKWKWDWRRQRRGWKREFRAMMRHERWWSPHAAPRPIGYAAHVWAGVTLPVVSLLHAAIFWCWLAVLLSLLTTGTIFGTQLSPDVPFWAWIIIGAADGVMGIVPAVREIVHNFPDIVQEVQEQLRKVAGGG